MRPISCTILPNAHMIGLFTIQIWKHFVLSVRISREASGLESYQRQNRNELLLSRSVHREILWHEESPVQRRTRHLQEVPYTNDENLRVPQSCRGESEPEISQLIVRKDPRSCWWVGSIPSHILSLFPSCSKLESIEGTSQICLRWARLWHLCSFVTTHLFAGFAWLKKKENGQIWVNWYKI